MRHLNQSSVWTASDNRFSSGRVYQQLGFEMSHAAPPSYVWVHHTFPYLRLNKRACRHQHLPRLLGNQYNPAATEDANMKAAGYSKVWDAGYKIWRS